MSQMKINDNIDDCSILELIQCSFDENYYNLEYINKLKSYLQTNFYFELFRQCYVDYDLLRKFNKYEIKCLDEDFYNLTCDQFISSFRCLFNYTLLDYMDLFYLLYEFSKSKESIYIWLMRKI